jgi:uncharacterized membrane protein
MEKNTHKTVLCQVCKEQKRPSEVLPAGLVREPLSQIIRATYPDWSTDGFICIADLNHFRAQYVQDVIKNDKGELSELEEQVINSIKNQELLSKDINAEYDQQLTLGERLSDKLADFGGSWRFISIFAAILFLWIALNSIVLFLKPFDPYPFIFLNLILSCLAAIQAPIIMMSQNRQEERDRLHAEHDYRINLKAELEIRNLHDKIDHLLTNQWQRLLEIQEIQMELMEELVHKGPKSV